MASPSSPNPNVTDFTTFIRNVAGIPAAYLPDTSPSIQHAFDYALDTVLCELQAAPSQPTSWSPYALAIYNLGTHVLIEYAQDQSFALASLSWAAGVVSGATTAANTMVPGDQVAVTGVSPLGYSGPMNSQSSLNLAGQGYPYGYVIVQSTPTNTTFTYNLAINPGAATLLAGAAISETFFTSARARLKLGQFTPGVVTSTSDVGTSVGLNNPEFMKGLTLENLQLLRTVFGRSYIAIAQKFGPVAWGLS